MPERGLVDHRRLGLRLRRQPPVVPRPLGGQFPARGLDGLRASVRVVRFGEPAQPERQGLFLLARDDLLLDLHLARRHAPEIEHLREFPVDPRRIPAPQFLLALAQAQLLIGHGWSPQAIVTLLVETAPHVPALASMTSIAPIFAAKVAMSLLPASPRNPAA